MQTIPLMKLKLNGSGQEVHWIW